MSAIRNIRFSLPCKENINDMASCGRNKHCKTCERIIIDFRNKSAEELEQLKKKNQSICGIFSEKQVMKGYERYFQLAAATALTIGLSSSFQNLYAQEEEDPFKLPATKSSGAVCPTVPKQMDIVGVIIDDSPEYPGGWAALKDFLKENIVYPADSIEGKVYVSFTVDTAGHVTDVRIKKSLSPLADAEVIRVVKLLVFKPALLEGKPIRSKFSLPVTFNREKKK
ncbi:energy transducer TonB [uncultured Fluviicola sp.]|uniref:energy transducer TonB n=1 Tax=uncultured Fluviicola sp. TaxID=463303 RepID=UPI0025FE9849|nr:energy transducer TonB [uncultured Fluviicola sp.]